MLLSQYDCQLEDLSKMFQDSIGCILERKISLNRIKT